MGYNIVFGFGVAFLLTALFFFNKTRKFLQSTERATARVVQLEENSSSDGSTWKPVFEFTTLTGQKVTHRHKISSNPPSWKVGDETTIAYKPDTPERARILSYFSVFGLELVLACIASVLLLIGGGHYLAKLYLK
jgi:hypothetical protein